jgi:carotenoid cleavage dioxygenase
MLNLHASSEAKASNPYLSGVHEPMHEELTIENLAVTGTIPPTFDGRYLRMGSNPMAPNPAKYHWFSGDGMLHGIRIQDGRALWYRNRWIRSDAVSKALGEKRVDGPRHAFDTVNTNVVGFGGRTFGVVEAGSTPVEIGERLETLRYTDFDGTLHGSFTAHPHVDPLTGEMQAVCYDVSGRDVIRYVVVTPEGKVRREVRIPVKHGPMIHDCAFTQRFAIIFDLPVTFSLASGATGHPFPYRWNESHAARVGLLPREGEAQDIIWCPVDPCYIFHALNSFDLPDGRVLLDVIVHDRMFSDIKSGPDSRRCALERWTIDPATRAIERVVIDASPQEFPRPDERRLGQPYRYGYTMALTFPFLGAGLYKHDMELRTRQFHDFGPGRLPCEFMFVPAHPQAQEDEGWLFGFVIDAKAGTTDLVILDARNFEGEPQASIHIPHIVPPGFHGNWLPNG